LGSVWDNSGVSFGTFRISLGSLWDWVHPGQCRINLQYVKSFRGEPSILISYSGCKIDMAMFSRIHKLINSQCGVIVKTESLCGVLECFFIHVIPKTLLSI